MLSQNFLFRGIDEPLPEMLSLRAGPLTMLFDNGDLRSVCLGEREILRRVYLAVRDRHWGTISAALSNLRIQLNQNTFTIEYDIRNRRDEIDFAWHAVLSGDSDGRVTFSADGEARTTFEKNRIGFCVLLPAALSGQLAQVEHVDGTREDAFFPLDLCADQPVRPFEDLRAVCIPLGPLGNATVQFTGDTFEMEDQRLWTDASFKIFCTPLALAHPVQIQAGTHVTQQILLSIAAPPDIARVSTHRDEQPLRLALPPDEAWKPLPWLGLNSASHDQPLTAGEIEQLKALHLHHLRVDLPLADPEVPKRLERAKLEAEALKIGLEMALFISADKAHAELTTFRHLLNALQPVVISWLIYPAIEMYAGGSPIAQVLAAAREHLADFIPGAPFAAGTNMDFIFAKHTPPPTDQIDQVCIAFNPQVHAFDDLSLIETFEGQAMVVESARLLGRGLPVVVSPITLKPRFNPHASGPQGVTPPGALPPQVDPRQRSLFAASWTLGSLSALAAAGAASLTCFETSGWRGVIERSQGSPWPDSGAALPGIAFPLYHVFADVGEFAGGQAAALTPSGNQSISSLALRLGSRTTYLIANQTSSQQAIALTGPAKNCLVRSLNAANAEFAMRSPAAYRNTPFTQITSPVLTLPPYGLIRCDLAL